MLNVRSKNLAEYAVRMLFVVLLGLAVHCAMAVAKGGGGKSAFDFDRPERRRILLVVILAVGAAAVVMLPTNGATPGKGETAKKDGERAKVRPADEPSGPVEPPKPAEPPTPAEPPKPEAPPTPAERLVSVERQVASVPPRAEIVKPAARPTAPVRRDASQKEADRPLMVKPRVSNVAERRWKSARKIRHGYIPDPIRDGHYLRLVRDAAMGGHPDALAKLSEYASRRRVVVEAYYWMRLAQLCGFADAEANLKACRQKWRQRGCPVERENVSAIFTERQSVLGRALLRLDCGESPRQALLRIRAMAAEGDGFAVRILNALSEREDI